MFDECECTNQWCPFYCTWRDVFYLLCSPCRLDLGVHWETNSALPPSCCFFFCADCGSRLLLRCIKVYDNQTFILKPQATYYPIPISAISNCTNLTARPSCHWIQKLNHLNGQKEEDKNVHSGFYLEMRDYVSKFYEGGCCEIVFEAWTTLYLKGHRPVEGMQTMSQQGNRSQTYQHWFMTVY